MAVASTTASRPRSPSVRAGGKKRPRAIALEPRRAVKLPKRRRGSQRPSTDASKDHRDAHTRGNDLPWVLRARAARDGDTAPVRTDRLTCCVYCDDAMFANALLAVGSFRRFAPGARLVLFVRDAGQYAWLRNVELVEAEEPLRAVSIGVDDFSRLHHDITGHYYRKAAMWLYMLQRGAAEGIEWLAFSDADVLFVQSLQPMLRHVRGHRFAAMNEWWHQSLHAIYRAEDAPARRQIDQLFHGRASPRRMRRTYYFNTGFMLARPDDDLVAAVKDVLAASLLYPDMSRRISYPEQTLMNLAILARGVRCRDLFGLCVASYHDEERSWPAPVARHYLGDAIRRQPELLRARHRDVVDGALAAIGTTVDELRLRGLWPDPVTAEAWNAAGQRPIRGIGASPALYPATVTVR
jgi:hypothetical protein